MSVFLLIIEVFTLNLLIRLKKVIIFLINQKNSCIFEA